MDKYKETFNTWNKIAQLYQDTFMTIDLYNQSYLEFSNLINSPKASILDLGCGPANILANFYKINPSYKLTGYDIAPNMIRLAKANLPNSNFKVMDVRKLNTHSKKYDAIIAGFVIPYLSSKESRQLIEDCKGILTKNGKLYLSFVPGNKNKSGFISGSTGDRMYFNYHSIENIKVELMKQNYTILKELAIKYTKGELIEIHTILMAEFKSI